MGATQTRLTTPNEAVPVTPVGGSGALTGAVVVEGANVVGVLVVGALSVVDGAKVVDGKATPAFNAVDHA